jgi:hypothetical protein
MIVMNISVWSSNIKLSLIVLIIVVVIVDILLALIIDYFTLLIIIIYYCVCYITIVKDILVIKVILVLLVYVSHIIVGIIDIVLPLLCQNSLIGMIVQIVSYAADITFIVYTIWILISNIT